MQNKARFQTLLIGVIILFTSSCDRSEAPFDILEQGEIGRVTRVSSGDRLVLSTGQSVRLTCIEAPHMPRFRDGAEQAGESYSEESRRILENIVQGREVQLYYSGLSRDRYDRALAQVKTADSLGDSYWINREMIRRGGARVRLYPDTATGCATLFETEQVTREARLGLWRKRAHHILDAHEVANQESGFHLVEGRLLPHIQYPQIWDEDRHPPACILNFQNSHLNIWVEDAAKSVCENALIHDTRIRVRGYMVRRDTTQWLWLTHALNLEVLSEDQP